ncbi:TRAP transporter substrate-binding protein [Mameliella sp. AT18]|jgi:TRAP-type mannitol/chloroaromatic compound transport system substrate-binding protein|uniref:TRAP transporter substrate-binding protein n=1 Tax=Mameliella sp. AT18 TaxID=3028385 RepID=UPI0008412327|nr:TRAP transporter substrate-binding protein [Mameliella sp. AT18]MDD9733037.1 TRAP transporter substrate-binding protein [Mameliella sp. AT18]ODM49737.1 C4-dicarboxylate ABC transporter substrate-binding protein [Ruegeria sp. PBVC088]
MKFEMLKTLSRAGVVAVAALATASAASAADRVLKIQTSSNASHASLAYLNEEWVPKLEAMTGGTLTVELLPINAVVPRRETPEAIGVGILDGDLTSINYFAGVDPAFALMGDLIAGYDSADQIQAFCAQGGGKEMLQKLFDAHYPGVHVVGCGAYAREAFVSKVPVRGVADLAGLKIRSPEGLAADVFKRAGAAPVSMAGSETYGALEKGVIDAADNSAYANNDANGMHKIAKYPIYPGIHSTPILQFTVSEAVWEELTEAERVALETWYLAAYNGLRQHFDRLDRQLVARDKAEGEITVIDWPQEERDKFRKIAQEAWEDFAAGSDLAKEVYDAHVAFMKEAGLL